MFLSVVVAVPLFVAVVVRKPRRGVEFAFEFARFQHFKRRLQARAIKNLN